MTLEIPVGPGQDVHMSFAGLKRSKDIWGEDTHDFRPERWLAENVTKRDVYFDVYHNLGNSAGGNVSNCLGLWDGGLQMQTYMVEIFRNFSISYPETGRKVLRASDGVMPPVLEGEPGKSSCPCGRSPTLSSNVRDEDRMPTDISIMLSLLYTRFYLESMLRGRHER